MQLTTIQTQLEELRYRTRLYLALTGVAKVLLVVLLFAIGSFILDWWFNFAPATRLFLLLAGFAAIVFTACRHLIGPLLLRLNNEDLALLIEQQFPELKEKLISAVQFAGEPDVEHSGTSKALLDVVLVQAESLVTEIDTTAVLSFRRPSRLVTTAAVLLLLAVGYSVTNFSLVGIWATRLTNPFSQKPWPRKTELQIRNLAQESKLPRGDNLNIEIEVIRGRVRTVLLDMVNEKENKSLRRLKQSSNGFYNAFYPRVNHSLKFRARGGDDETAWYTIEVVERPRVERVHVEIEFPKYTRKQQETFAEGQGDIHAVVGTLAKVRAESDQDIKGARLVIENGPETQMIVREKRTAAGEFVLEKDYTAYLIEVTTDDDVANSNPLTFKLKPVPDAPPKIHLESQEKHRDHTSVATVPLRYKVTDDYGIGKVKLKWKRTRKAIQEIDDRAGESALPGLTAGSLKIESTYEWKLSVLKPSEGEEITYFLEATDEDDVHGPNVGRTREFIIRIVSRSELEASLVRKEQAVHRELQRLLKRQESVHQRLEDILSALDQRGQLNEKEQESHVKAELEQRQATRDADKLLANVDSMLEDVKGNKIDDFERQDQLEDVASTLKKLAKHPMREASELIQQARADSKTESPDRQKLSKAEKRQVETVEQLRELLARLGEQGEIDQLINDARSLANRQKRINNRSRETAVKTLGKKPNELNDKEKAELNELARDQLRTSEQMKAFEDKLAKFASQQKEKNPKLAEKLNEILSNARSSQIGNEMNRAHKDIQENRLLSVLSPQKKIHQELQKILADLRESKDSNSGGLEQLKRDLRDSLRNLAKLAQNQRFLQDKAKSAGEEKQDIEKVRRDIEQLRKKQKDLQEQTNGLPEDQTKAQAKMNELSERQSGLEEQNAALGENTEQLSQNLAQKSGLRSEKMKKASEQIKKAGKSMNQASRSLSESKPEAAKKGQTEAQNFLAEAERLSKEAQENLKKESASEMPRMGEKQKDFIKQAEEMKQKIEKAAQTPKAEKHKIGSEMSQAAKNMEEASKAMKESQAQLYQKDPEGAEKSLEKTQSKLAKAFEEVSKALQKLAEDERSKKLAKIKDAVVKMLQTQMEINETLVGAQDVWLKEKRVPRSWRPKLLGAARKEESVHEAARTLIESFQKEDAIVVAWQLKRTDEKVVRLTALIQSREVDYYTTELCRSVINDLNRLLAQINNQGRNAGNQDGSKPQSPNQGGQMPMEKPPLIPPLTELKMLRDLQLEIYQATKAIELERIMRPWRPLAPWKAKRLEQMVDRQGELARIAERLGMLMQEQRKGSQ